MIIQTVGCESLTGVDAGEEGRRRFGDSVNNSNFFQEILLKEKQSSKVVAGNVRSRGFGLFFTMKK